MADAPIAPDVLERFRRVQRLAYECAEAVAATLAPGVTERQAAAAMGAWLEARGVDDWFHRPFAWFGERTALEGVRFIQHLSPTDRALEAGMPYILDCAPVLEGHPADIGWAGCLGESDEHRRLIDDLAAHRELVLASVRAGRTMREVYEDVDGLLARQGHTNRHRRYPLGVLGHRVGPVGGLGRDTSVVGFGLTGVRALTTHALSGPSRWPFWGPGCISHRPPAAGLWAIEPHLGHETGKGTMGAKFEEMLLIPPEGPQHARWLDDDLPHVRRWRTGA